MLFTWVPQLGRHILWQQRKSQIYLLLSVGFIIPLPLILHPVIKDVILDDLAAEWAQAHLWFALACFVGVLVGYELLVFFFSLRHRWPPGTLYSDSIALHRLSAKALLRRAPRMMFTNDSKTLNIGIVTSFASGHFIFFPMRAAEVLNEREQEVVIAHEIAHAKHIDRAGDLFFWASGLIFEVYFFAFVVTAILGPPSGFGLAYSIAMFWAAVIVFLLQNMHHVIHCAYRRAREYLADAAAVGLAGWEFRGDLVSALQKIDRDTQSNWPQWIAYGYPEFLRTHPCISNRAKVLGLDASKIVI